MERITVDVWLYGPLARHGGGSGGHANRKVELPSGSTLADLLDLLRLPSVERGITFINGQLSAMPGVQPDLDHVLHDGDRVGLFHLGAMWPFQYRHGAPTTKEMLEADAARRQQPPPRASA